MHLVAPKATKIFYASVLLNNTPLSFKTASGLSNVQALSLANRRSAYIHTQIHTHITTHAPTRTHILTPTHPHSVSHNHTTTDWLIHVQRLQQRKARSIRQEGTGSQVRPARSPTTCPSLPPCLPSCPILPASLPNPSQSCPLSAHSPYQHPPRPHAPAHKTPSFSSKRSKGTTCQFH